MNVAATFASVLPVVLFRSFPFAFSVCATRRATLPFRVSIITTFLAAIIIEFRFGRERLYDVAWVPVVYLYFLLVACGVYWLSGAVSRRAIRAGAVLFASALFFVVLPACVSHHASIVAMLVIGWEATLSAHSYGIETHGRPRPPLLAATFFLLVNPTVVYAERGTGDRGPRADLQGICRIIVGTITMGGRSVALLLIGRTSWLRSVGVNSVSNLPTYVQFCAVSLVLALGLFCAHSGLAHIQIGWMRLLGHRLPERYVYPFMATSPADFWNRWNTWIGRWAYRYIYIPLGRRMMRALRGSLAVTWALLLSFLGVGFLHDFGVFAVRMGQSQGSVSLRFTFIFGIFGLVLVAWREGARFVRRFVDRQARWVRCVGIVLARLLLVQIAILLLWLAIPVLRSNVLPPTLERIWRWSL